MLNRPLEELRAKLSIGSDARERPGPARERERRREPDERRGGRRRAEQEPGGEAEVDRLLAVDTEREQHCRGRADVGDRRRPR